MTRSARMREWEAVAIRDLQARWDLPGLVIVSETTSTNDVARRMARHGAPAGLLVMAEHQSAGRGRLKRSWTDAPGRSLLTSVVLRPSSSSGPAPGTVPLRVGMAVASALRSAAGIKVQLKWPNDIVEGGAKLAGILCEAVSTGGESVIIAGVGVNVLQSSDEWPAELRGLATSVADVAERQGSRRVVDRLTIMDAIVAALRPLFTRPLEPLRTDELRAFATMDALRGLHVTAGTTGLAAGESTAAGQVRGVASGIAADGALLIESDGSLRRVTSATVRRTGLHSHPVP
ncbi:MAG: biotin--[acetyl-CoA-carboxylase] ligase [Gemmatimonadetes bacterium]|nr:biotin--[acetyl-CoA-carboxylase] ligase [Gemmatimonadota bacterium]